MPQQEHWATTLTRRFAAAIIIAFLVHWVAPKWFPVAFSTAFKFSFTLFAIQYIAELEGGAFAFAAQLARRIVNVAMAIAVGFAALYLLGLALGDGYYPIDIYNQSNGGPIDFFWGKRIISGGKDITNAILLSWLIIGVAVIVGLEWWKHRRKTAYIIFGVALAVCFLSVKMSRTWANVPSLDDIDKATSTAKWPSFGTMPPGAPGTSASTVITAILAEPRCTGASDVNIDPGHTHGSASAKPGCTSGRITIKKCSSGLVCPEIFDAASTGKEPFGAIYHVDSRREFRWYPDGKIPDEIVPSNVFEIVVRDKPATIRIVGHYT